MLLALLLALASAGPAASGDARLAKSLLQRIEQHSARTRDLVAQFVQSYRSGVLGREITERGRVWIKRPGLMRWEYLEPERKLFVSDGSTFYFYVPADRQVIVSEQDPRRSLAGRLLSGKADLSQEFTPRLEEPKEPGVLRLRLVPRQEQPDLQSVQLDVTPAGQIRSIVLVDVQGNETRFRFEHVRENVGLKDDLFRFKMPKGVEVIHG